MGFKLLPRHRQLRRIVSLSGCLAVSEPVPFSRELATASWSGCWDCVAPATRTKGWQLLQLHGTTIVKNTQPGASRTWTVNQNSFSAEKWKWKANGKRRTENGKRQKKGVLFECASDSAQFTSILLPYWKLPRGRPAQVLMSQVKGVAVKGWIAARVASAAAGM